MAKQKDEQNHDVQELLDKVAALESEALALLEENERLRKALDEKQIVNSATVQPVVKVEAADLPTFHLDGKTYRFRVHSFRADGQKRLSAVAAADPVQCALILEKYPSLVQEI